MSKEQEWQIDGGERVGGRNVLPHWSIYTEEFPDTAGATGCGIVCYSKSTFAYLHAEKPIADMILVAVNSHEGLLEACKLAMPHHQGGHSQVGFAIKAAVAKAESEA